MLTESDARQKEMSEEQLTMKGKQEAHYEVKARVCVDVEWF